MKNNFVVDAISRMTFNVLKAMALTFMVTGIAVAFWAAILPVEMYDKLPEHLILDVMRYWLAAIAFAGLIRVALRPLNWSDLKVLWLGWFTYSLSPVSAKYPESVSHCSCMKLAKSSCYETRGCWHLASKSVWIELSRDVIALGLMVAIYCAIAH